MDEGTSIGRILLFDDDRDYRNLLKAYIEKYLSGVEIHEYDPVSKGAPGDDFDWSRYDVLILDYYLCIYGFTGLDLLQKHRKKPGFPATVMLTGAGDEEIAVRALNFGVYDYLRKEKLSKEQLIESINNAFHKHHEELIKQREQERANNAFDKALFYKLLEHQAEVMAEGKGQTLMVVEVNDLKQLTSEYGLIVRDNLFRHIARKTYEKLKDSVNPYITRLGDESAGVLIDYPGSRDLLENEIQQLCAHLDANPYLFLSKPVPFTVSIGAVIIDQEENTITSLIEQANQIRNIARQTPGNSCHISSLTEILETENRRKEEEVQKRKAEEEQQRKDEEERLCREEEKRRESERLCLEEEKHKAAEAARLKAVEEEQLRLAALEKQLKAEEQRRKEAEEQLRLEAEKHKLLEEAERKRKQQEVEQRRETEEAAEREKLRQQEELQRKQEEEQLRQEEVSRKKAEEEQKQKEEQQRKEAEARQQAEEEKLRLVEQERLRLVEEKRKAEEAAEKEKQQEEEISRQKTEQASSDDIIIDESTLDENSLTLKKAFNEHRVVQTFQPVIAMFTPDTGDAPAMFKVDIEMVDEHGNIVTSIDIDRQHAALALQQFTDRWILREIIGRIASTDESRIGKIYLITISDAWLADITLFTWLKKLLTGFENIKLGNSIALELPVNMLITHKKRAPALIKALKQSHGFGIAIGEVNTADELKSVSGLKDIDLLTVKWSLVDGMRKQTDENGDISIISVLKSQGTHIIFDDIEDSTTLTDAIGLGMDYAMGTFIGEPQSSLAGTGNVETFDISY